MLKYYTLVIYIQSSCTVYVQTTKRLWKKFIDLVLMYKVCGAEVHIFTRLLIIYVKFSKSSKLLLKNVQNLKFFWKIFDFWLLNDYQSLYTTLAIKKNTITTKCRQWHLFSNIFSQIFCYLLINKYQSIFHFVNKFIQTSSLSALTHRTETIWFIASLLGLPYLKLKSCSFFNFDQFMQINLKFEI